MMRGKIKYVVLLLIVAFVGLKFYKYSPYKIELLGHYSKIGAHRLNSEYRLQSASKYFNILEFDLVYSKKTADFDITHPPASSIQLTLESHIQNLPKGKYPFLWLDIKNLDVTTEVEILKRLKEVFQKVNYPFDKILVETRYPKILSHFDAAGFNTSYYLPYGLSLMSEIELHEKLNKIDKTLSNQPNLAISSDIDDYELLSKKFPKRIKYHWATGMRYSSNFCATRSALNDSTVKIILVSYSTKKGNR